MFVGVDGCKAGWFTVCLTEDKGWQVDVSPDISSLWNQCHQASVILIDVPIGLREGGTQERLCDTEARKLLGPKRRSSVFPAPCRPAIYAKSYGEACNINERMTGKRLSLETWNIIPKIREVDCLLSNDDAAKLRIREIHPELCFWALAGHPMKYSKKQREGLLERIQVLSSIYPQTPDIINDALSTYRRKEVSRDDILDALSAVVIARMGEEKLVSIPQISEFDARGLRMEMVYYYTVR